jgi:hypothetical protein
MSQKRSNDGVFSPDTQDYRRVRTDLIKELNPSMLDENNELELDGDAIKNFGKDIPDWVEPFAKYLSKSICSFFRNEINDSMCHNFDELKDVHSTVKSVMVDYMVGIGSDMTDMKNRVKKLESENKMLKRKMAENESYSRRWNLVIEGVPERRNENLFKWFRYYAENELNLWNNISLERIHRVGPPQHWQGNRPPRPRSIIVRFTHFQDRQDVWYSRFDQETTNFIIKEDFPPEVVESRKRLLPIAKEARDLNMKATVTNDKLLIDGKTYDVESLDTLPTSLIPASKSYQETTNQISFFRKYCPLSNHSSSPFELPNEKSYNCNEQLFLSEKCLAYGHEKAAKNILEMTDPAKMVNEAKVCKGYNEFWEESMYPIMLTGLLAKFEQNPEHKEFLLNTGQKRLVEGSPYDTVWGVGIAYYSRWINNPERWRGENLLGQALMQARNMLQSASSVFQPAPVAACSVYNSQYNRVRAEIPYPSHMKTTTEKMDQSTSESTPNNGSG